ncbi:MAG: metallophosphoesterase family protein, partial [Phocaeicola sp.]
MKKYIMPLFVGSLLVLTGCEMLETHPYDTKITGEIDINRKNIEKIEHALKDKTSFRFAMISDTQRWYDETVDVVEVLNARGDIDFVLHGGDQTDFGLTNEFIWMRDILNNLNMPYVCVIGNHDCLGTGKDSYRTIYGATNTAFTAGDMRFICI